MCHPPSPAIRRGTLSLTDGNFKAFPIEPNKRVTPSTYDRDSKHDSKVGTNVFDVGRDIGTMTEAL
jgi:hypothetical protein